MTRPDAAMLQSGLQTLPSGCSRAWSQDHPGIRFSVLDVWQITSRYVCSRCGDRAVIFPW